MVKTVKLEKWDEDIKYRHMQAIRQKNHQACHINSARCLPGTQKSLANSM